ncbi:hypothetical protein LCGC14_1945310, partial [marine sediment metagenome]
LPTILGGAIGGAAGSLVIKRYNFKKFYGHSIDVNLKICLYCGHENVKF